MEQILYTNIIPKINPSIDITHRDNEYVVTLTESNHHLKISQKVFNLLRFVDNEKNISQIVKEYNISFKSEIDDVLVHEILYNKLGFYNIIEDIEGNDNFDTNKQPSYLKLNIIIINATTAKILSKPFLFLFSKKTLKLLILICLAITSITFISNFDEILINIKDISIEYFILYISIMLISSVLHEIGHVSATYRFGGEHSGIGIGFYLFTPVLYANVSSAWKFNVNKRIIVNLAGIYFELLFGTVLILVSFLVGIKSLLIVPSIILAKTLFNLNPFFRTDGYWILSDYTKTPNLRFASNNLLKSFVKSKFQLNLKRKELFLIFYAIISNSFIFIFLFYLFVKNPNSLISFPVDIYDYINQIINKKILFSMNSMSHLFIPIFFYMLLIRFLLGYLKKKSNIKR